MLLKEVSKINRVEQWQSWTDSRLTTVRPYEKYIRYVLLIDIPSDLSHSSQRGAVGRIPESYGIPSGGLDGISQIDPGL